MYYYFIKDVASEDIVRDKLGLVMNSDIVLRKVKDGVYFLICDNAKQSFVVLNTPIEECKARMLKDSPDNIR